MAKSAIDQMKDHPNGFVLQIEGGKVDWSAHANDVAALIHDQIAFDEAVKAAVDFAEKDGNTLVIITTDHGNANPEPSTEVMLRKTSTVFQIINIPMNIY